MADRKLTLGALTLGFAAGLALGPASAATIGIPGVGDVLGGLLGQGSGSSSSGEAGRVVARGTRVVEGGRIRSDETTLADFDPVHDVPAMKNWVGAIDNEGSGNCYGMALLTTYFHEKVEFVPGRGLTGEAWKKKIKKRLLRSPDLRPALRHPLHLDAAALDLMPRLLGRSLKSVREYGKLRLTGAASLREFTAEGTATRKRFEQWAEAIQFAVQVPHETGGYLRNAARSGLDALPLVGGQTQAMNSSAAAAALVRIRAGRPAMITIHDNNSLSGHVLVGYRVRRYADRTEIDCHDVNRPPKAGRSGELAPLVVTIVQPEDGALRVERSGQRVYDFTRVADVLEPDSKRNRHLFFKVAGNYQEYLQRNHHLGNLIGKDRSLWTRVRGGAGFVGEVLNPF